MSARNWSSIRWAQPAIRHGCSRLRKTNIAPGGLANGFGVAFDHSGQNTRSFVTLQQWQDQKIVPVRLNQPPPGLQRRTKPFHNLSCPNPPLIGSRNLILWGLAYIN